LPVCDPLARAAQAEEPRIDAFLRQGEICIKPGEALADLEAPADTLGGPLWDISNDIAAVQSRIAEITGTPPGQATPAQSGNFAALVQQALAGRTAAGSMPTGIPVAPYSSLAANQPLIVPPAQIEIS